MFELGGRGFGGNNVCVVLLEWHTNAAMLIVFGGLEVDLGQTSGGERSSLSKSPQLDVLLAGYAVQRSECSAMYGTSTSMLGLIVGTMGFVVAFVKDFKEVSPVWLALLSILPWGMLSYHSVLIGVNAGHSYVCEVYERILAEVAPDGIVYREKRAGDRVILGVTVGERILDHRRASISRVVAVVYAYSMKFVLPILYSSAILVALYEVSQFWFVFSVVSVLGGATIVAINEFKNACRSEVKDIDGVLRLSS